MLQRELARALEVLRLYQDIQLNFDKVFTLAKPWTSMSLGPDKSFQKLNAVAGASRAREVLRLY